MSRACARARRPTRGSRLVRLARRDDGVSEVVGYILTFAMGAAVLVMAMNVMTTATNTSSEITSASRLKQAGQLVAAGVLQTGAVVTAAPNATFSLFVDIPPQAGKQSYNGSIIVSTVPGGPGLCNKQAHLRLQTADGSFVTNVSLGNVSTINVGGGAQCLDLSGDFSSSSGTVRILYDAEASPPALNIRQATKVT